MDRESMSPNDEASQDKPIPPVEWDTSADELVMPQEDDPAGDGHMWSGDTDAPEEWQTGRPKLSGHGHIPNDEADPIPF